MKPLDPAQMLEATRLTRAGRLADATTLLRRALGGSNTPPPAKKSRATSLVPASDSEIPAEPAQEGSPLAALAAAIPLKPKIALKDLDWTAKLPGARGRAVDSAEIAPSAGQYLSGSYSNAAGSLAYKLYVPSRRGRSPRPLIVMLHGCTQSADDFATGTRMNFAAETRGCFVVYPEQSQSANATKCWNWFRASDQTRDSGEPALIAGITRNIMSEYAIDPRRVFVAGLSAGGAAAAIMGETYPDLYAAVGVHSGLARHSAHDFASAFSAMRGGSIPRSADGDRIGKPLVPTIVFHGDQDSTVHPSNGTKVINRANGDVEMDAETADKTAASGHRYSHTVQHDAEGRSVLELWQLHGAGHAWSGGSPAGSFTSPDGPDATEEMLRFFLAQARAAD